MLKVKARFLLFKLQLKLYIHNKYEDYKPEALHILEQFYVSVKTYNFFFFPARTLETIVILTAHFVSPLIPQHEGKEFRACALPPFPSSAAGSM